MMRTIFHIGLHKTASTFLQKKVFPELNGKERYIYNPEIIMKDLHKLLYREFLSTSQIEKIVNTITQNFKKLENKNTTLLISDENFSQTTFYQNYKESIDLIKKIFPNAEILIFFRFQTDWLYSCYKQTVKMGDWQRFEDFVHFSSGQFSNDSSNYNKSELLCMNVYDVDYEIFLREFANIHVFFYEDFKRNQKETLSKISRVLSTDFSELELNSDNDKVNISFNDRMVELLILLKKINNIFNVKLLINYKEQRRGHFDAFYNENLCNKEKQRIMAKRKLKLKLRKIIYSLLLKLTNNKYNKNRDEIFMRMNDFFYKKNCSLKHLLEEKKRIDLPRNYYIQ